MKKSILIVFAIGATVGLTAFSLMNWDTSVAECGVPTCHVEPTAECSTEKVASCQEVVEFVQNPDFYLNVDNRWGSMTKEDLMGVRSIHDVIGGCTSTSFGERNNFRNVWVAVLHNPKDDRDIETGAIGQSEIFDEDQLAILANSDYSTNLRFTTACDFVGAESGETMDDTIVKYMTVVPEKQAFYQGGKDALLHFVQNGMKEHLTKEECKNLQSGKVFFTVTEEGLITNIKLVESCGHSSLDEQIKSIIADMPHRWTPAESADGEHVSQELVFSFGNMGC